MDNTSYVALSRQTVLERQMEIVANNVANVNTTAFKGEDSLFSEFLVPVQTEDRIFRDKLSFVRDLGTVRNMDEGPLQATSNPLDVALHGDGFFVVESPQGPQYTRAGHFRLDQDGQMVTNDGIPVMSADNQPFFFAPNESRISIGKDGTVSTENGDIGKLKVVQFEDQQALRKVASGRFTTDQQPTDVPRPDVQQGSLERSNVEPVVEMTKLIAIHRAYQGVTKMIEMENARQRKAVNTLSKIAQ